MGETTTTYNAAIPKWAINSLMTLLFGMGLAIINLLIFQAATVSNRFTDDDAMKFHDKITAEWKDGIRSSMEIITVQLIGIRNELQKLPPNSLLNRVDKLELWTDKHEEIHHNIAQ